MRRYLSKIAKYIKSRKKKDRSCETEDSIQETKVHEIYIIISPDVVGRGRFLEKIKMVNKDVSKTKSKQSDQ